MANEIKVTASLQIDNGNFRLPRIGGQTLRFDQSSPGGMIPGMVLIGTSEEDISLGDISTPGWVYMRNLDTVNYVQWGPKNAGSTMQALGRLRPGEPALFRLEPGITLRMKADTAACKVLILVNED